MAKYTFEVVRDENGNLFMKSTSDGFLGFEVLGFLDFKCDDIRRQLRDEIAPDYIERTVIGDKESDMFD
jgi:hypothetical protein